MSDETKRKVFEDLLDALIDAEERIDMDRAVYPHEFTNVQKLTMEWTERYEAADE